MIHYWISGLQTLIVSKILFNPRCRETSAKMIYPLIKVVYWSFLVLLFSIYFSLKFCYCVLCIQVLWCWVNKYLQMLHLPVKSTVYSYNAIIFFVSYCHDCLTVYFSGISIATWAFFWFPFALDIFLQLFTFCLSMLKSEMSLLLAAYSRILFFIHSATLCFLIGEFSLLAVKLIIDRYGLSAIFLIDFWLFYNSFVPFFSCSPSLWFDDFSVMVCLDDFLFTFFVSIINFCFEVTVRFT